MNLRDNIKNLRRFRSLTQEELAEKVNSKRANIAAYEEGRCEPPLETLIRLSKFFGVSLDNLICGEMEEKREIRFK